MDKTFKFISLAIASVALLIAAVIVFKPTQEVLGSYFNSVSISDGGYLGKTTEITPMGALRVSQSYRLVGAAFVGTTVDSNFWTVSTNTASTTVTQGSGQVDLNTGSLANGVTGLQSVRVARYIGASSNMFRGQIQLDNTGVANNYRRWGAFTATDGAFFQLSTTTFSVCTRKASVDTCVAQASWNGGNTFTLDTNANTYEIYWTNKTVYFTINDALAHKVTASAATWTDTVNLPVYLQNGNDSGAVSVNHLYARVASISRLGPLETQVMTNYTTGQTTGKILKIGAGNLHTISIGGVANTSNVTIYDGVSTGGTVIWSSGSMPNGTNPFTLDFSGAPFFTGLFIVISAANSNVQISYE